MNETHGAPGHRHPHPPDDPSGHPRIGFVGGGGIGYILKPRVDLGEWGEVGTLVLLIACTVWLMDIISAKIRERIV